MPYLAFDLDALEKAPNVARASHISEEMAIAGMARMWRHCYREQTDVVDATALEGFFGADTSRAMVTFRLLEATDGRFRVRGADRYLHIKKARIAGGKKAAAAGNLRRGRGQKPAGAQLESSPAGAGVELETLPSSTPALTAVSSQQEATTKDKTIVEQGSTASEVRQVFEHWQEKLEHPKAVLDHKRSRAIKARLREGRTVEDLKQAIDGCALTPHNIGVNDRGQAYDDIELICRDAAHVERFIRNAQAPPTPNQLRQPGRNPDLAVGRSTFDWEAYAEKVAEDSS